MRDLRTIRIFLASLFIAAAAAYLFIGSGITPVAMGAEKVQIIPSMLTMTMGATGFWLVATFVFGRIYCSTVCPVGALQDSATWLRRRLGASKTFGRLRLRRGARPIFAPFRYRNAGKWRGVVLLAYTLCLLLGLMAFATIIEPWNMLRSAARATNAGACAPWLIASGHVMLGAAFALAVLLAVWIAALIGGRRFCTEICPIGTLLGAVSHVAIYRIEIDPDRCTNCMRCEEVCKTEGIKVAGRYVDNERCVRCFDCLKVCPDDAINFQRGRNRRITPLLRKRLDESGTH